MKEHPWAKEMLLCDMMVAFLTRQKPRAGGGASGGGSSGNPSPAPLSARAPSAAAPMTGPKGEKLKVRSDADDEFASLLAGAGAGGKGKKGKQATGVPPASTGGPSSAAAANGPSSATASAASGGGGSGKAQPLRLSLEDISSFHLLSIPVRSYRCCSTSLRF